MGMQMASFALTIGSQPVRLETILLIFGDRTEAEEIAAELRRRGRDVEVHELRFDGSRPRRLCRDVATAPVGAS
jgi:hypothetical protein